MKICILTPRFPFPENGGDVLRINGIVRHLKTEGHTMSLISFSEMQKPDVHSARELYNNVYFVQRSKWESFLYSTLFIMVGKPIQCGYYYSRRFLNKVREIIDKEQPDLFVCHLLRTSIYCEQLHLENKTIVEMTDALSKTYSLTGSSNHFSIKKQIYKIERSLIEKYENHVTKVFPKVVLVSSSDVTYLDNRLGEDVESLKVHPNGVDCLEVVPDTYDANKICFIGNMRTLQNQEAVLHFAEKIFPIILRERPNARFYIIGAEPSQKIRNLASDNIIVTGFVDNITETVQDSCVAVAPVNIAAGIQNKVLVAMGCGVPVVLSILISKAIPELVDGVNCFISDDAQTFANKCVEIMNNSKLRNSLSRSAYEMVKDHYSWGEKLEGYEVIPT